MNYDGKILFVKILKSLSLSAYLNASIFND